MSHNHDTIAAKVGNPGLQGEHPLINLILFSMLIRLVSFLIIINFDRGDLHCKILLNIM